MITSSRTAIAQTTTKSTNRYNRLNQTNHFNKHNIQQCLTSKANLDTKRMQIYSKQTIGTITPSYHRQQQPKKFKKNTKKNEQKQRGRIPSTGTRAVVLGVRVPDVGVSHADLIRSRERWSELRPKP